MLQEYLPYYKRNLKVALPVMMTQIGASLVGLFDSIMVGHYATADLAAVSFSNAIFFTVMVFSMGALMGITPLIGIEIGHQSNGEDRSSAIAFLYRSGLLFASLLSIVMVILLGACIPLLGYFGQEEAVVTAARPYYTLIVLSIVPFHFFCAQKQFLEGLGNTMIAMIITLSMNLMNIGLNWVFIFGKFGFPAMGATGAGIATLISRTLMPLIFWLVIRHKPAYHQFTDSPTHRFTDSPTHRFTDSPTHQFTDSPTHQFTDSPTHRFTDSPTHQFTDSPTHQFTDSPTHQFTDSPKSGLRRLWQIGAPIGCQTTLETVLFTLSFIIIGWLGKESLAAHQIANQIADITFMLALGIGSATTIRVSHQLGRGDLHAVKMAANASIHLALLMNTIGAILMISLRNYIPHLFTDDPLVIPIASRLIVIAGLFQYADGLQCVGAAMLRGITDVKRPMVYAAISYLLISLPLGLVLMFPCGLGAEGMWLSFIVGLSLAALLFHLRFRKKLRESLPHQLSDSCH